MGGFVAFPGGKVHDADAALALPEQGLSASQVTAARELFEETGVLLARGPDAMNRVGDADHNAELARLRRDLLDDKILFADLLHRMGLHLEAGDLRPAGRLITPPFAPIRFDTAFFVADLPAGQNPEVWPGELTAGAFLSADAALAQWRQGEYPLSPPTVSILELIHGRPVEELPALLRPALDLLDAGRVPAIWFTPDVLMIPLDCQGLPPTTHTNAFLVGSARPISSTRAPPTRPSSRNSSMWWTAGASTRSCLRIITPTISAPRRPSPAVIACRSWPIRSPRSCLRGGWRSMPFSTTATSSTWARRAHGRGTWALHAVHTPGHAPGHLAFHEPDYQLLFVADMLSTLSSVIITPRDGNLRQYLDSLKRLQEYHARMLLPAHGPPTLRAAHQIAAALAHRATREQQLLDNLAQGPRSVDELALTLYRGYPPAVLKLAALQVQAGLIKLEEEGAVRSEEDRWRLVKDARF